MFTNKLILRKLSKKIVKMKCEGDRSDKSVKQEKNSRDPSPTKKCRSHEEMINI